jgi:hypothetical protein
LCIAIRRVRLEAKQNITNMSAEETSANLHLRNTPRPDASDASGQSNGIMSTIDPAFIHTILLTGPLEMPGGTNGTRDKTIAFNEFRQFLDDVTHQGKLDPSLVLKKAVRDHICEAISQNPNNVSSVKNFLLELHSKIRALIPNRKDLHSILEDDNVRNTQALAGLKSFILKAACALEKLESEARAETTLALIEELQKQQQQQSENGNQVEPGELMLWVTAIVYLLHKAELCEADKQEFYLKNVLAPRIHQEGHSLEKRYYQAQFGSFSDPNSSSATRQWIQSLVKSYEACIHQTQSGTAANRDKDAKLASLLASADKRKDLIRAGWVEDIIFRDANQKPMRLPEVFAHDSNRLQTLREVTRVAVAGCALALHACNSVGADSKLVLTSSEETSDIRRAGLIHALRDRSKPPNHYEENVANAVVALAQEWNSSLRGHTIEEDTLLGLKNRVFAVLRGDDPVLQLLNNRIKDAMREVLVSQQDKTSNDNVITPMQMRTGHGSEALQAVSEVTDSNIGRSSSEKLFCHRGFAFFASELMHATKLAGRVIDLAIKLYWDDFLDKVVVEACEGAQG